MHTVGGQIQLRREPRIASAELDGFSDDLTVDGLVQLLDSRMLRLDSGIALLKTNNKGDGGYQGQHREHRDRGTPLAAGTGDGPFAGMQEVALGAGQGRIPVPGLPTIV